MIQQLFTWLSNALNSTPSIAIIAAVTWGIFSILLSPCHLASIPLIVGFINGQGIITTRRAFWLATLFSTGILFTIAIIGIITGLLGRMLGDIGAIGNYFVGVIFLIVGLYLLGVLPLPFLNTPNHPSIKRKGFLAAFLLGFIFGIALGPCTFAYMAPILVITLNIASTRFLFGILLLFAYGIGHCSVIVSAGTFTEVVQRYLNWNEKSKGTIIVRKICGVLLILGGIYFIFLI